MPFTNPDYIETARFELENPTYQEMINLMGKSVQQKIKERQGENILVVYMFAGHGMILNGQQAILFNEVNKETGYYKLHPTEQTVRAFARVYPYSYHLLFCPCCRTNFKGGESIGCVEATNKEEATKKLEVIKKVKQELKEVAKDTQDKQKAELAHLKLTCMDLEARSKMQMEVA